MNDRQKRFCKYYIKTNDREASSLQAGYKKNAWQRLLKDEDINRYIKKLLKEDTINAKASSDEVIHCLTSIMRGDIGGDGIGEKQKEVYVREKLKAAELLGKAYSIFSGKQESQEEPIIIYGEDSIYE